MKKKIVFLLTLIIITCGSLVGCGFGKTPELPDYNADIQVAIPDIENFVTEEDKTYYTSPGFSLWMEVNGAYLEMDYFYLDGNKRVYDNLYFYEKDYFLIVTDDYDDLYASLSDPADSEYAEEEKEDGYDIQINIKKSGVYKLIFDLDTLKFDLEYKSAIETPVYYTIKNCSIYTPSTEWVEMSVNPQNEDEFVINNFTVGAGETISFFNYVHTSHYKVTLDQSCIGKFGAESVNDVKVSIGGKYNIFINKKTYVVRLELLNPDTATYNCVYYDGENFIDVAPVESNVPYLFKKRIVAETKLFALPKFYTAQYKKYDLTVEDSELLMSTEKNHYFKQAGTYDVTINLKTFTIAVEVAPE